MDIPPRIVAVSKRDEREARKKFRELERRLKEQAKTSELEQAKLEVEAFESQLAVLLSVHKTQGPFVDWIGALASLPPPVPQQLSRHKTKAAVRLEHDRVLRGHSDVSSSGAVDALDRQEYDNRCNEYHAEAEQCQKLRSLARRILNGEASAYTEALAEFSPLSEISELGSSIHFTVHSRKLVECRLKVDARHVIPKELKTLTASGKLSTKPMPKGRFHEIYQDYVCGCLLRVAREVFALLPVETLLITTFIDEHDSGGGQIKELAVLSAIIQKATLSRLNLDNADPSDAMENFIYRGNFKMSRKTGEFEPIVPLIISDVSGGDQVDSSVTSTISAARRFKDDLKRECQRIAPSVVSIEPETSDVV